MKNTEVLNEVKKLNNLIEELIEFFDGDYTFVEQVVKKQLQTQVLKAYRKGVEERNKKVLEANGIED